MVLLVAALFADDHQIIEDEDRSSMTLAEVWTSTQIKDFIDSELQDKMALRCGEFLERERESERATCKYLLASSNYTMYVYIHSNINFMMNSIHTRSWLPRSKRNVLIGILITLRL